MRWFKLSVLSFLLWGCSAQPGPTVVSSPQLASPRVFGAYPGSDVFFNILCYNGNMVVGLIASHDKSMWTEDANSDLVRIAMDGGTNIYHHAGILAHMTPNPDGNIYVAETYNGDGAIAKVTPTGNITDLPLPRGFLPSWLVSGSDGNLWITNGNAAGGIVRMTTSGSYTLFSDALVAGPSGISRGADKNVWVAVSGGLVRISVADGTPTFFPWGAGYNNTSLSQVNEGPDGGLWGADGKGIFYRMDTFGTVTTYQLDPNAKFGEVHGLPIAGPNKSIYWVDSFFENPDEEYEYDTVRKTVSQNGMSMTGGVAYAIGRDDQLWSCNDSGTDVLILHGIVTTPDAVTVGVGSTAPLAVKEPRSTQHSFKAVSENTGITTVSGTGESFVVTGVSAGSTNIKVSDKIGNSVEVPVSVN